MYQFGYGVPENASEAVRGYRKAAEQGYADAQYLLGVMHRDGHGVIKDVVEAHAWFNVASAQGFELAKTNLVKTKGKLTKDQIAEATKLAREYIEKYGKKK